MSTPIKASVPQQLSSVNLEPRGRVFPSPTSWRDQILYFLLPDRFSDGKEATKPTFSPANPSEFKTPDKATWMATGKKFQGGNIRGITSKLDYLKGLGVTTLWVGPIWRQRSDLETYHGYGIQNFLDVDPRFGSRQDLRDLVDAAHDRDMYVMLDIIYNHTGNNWFYDQNGNPTDTMSYRFQPPYPFHGWRSSTGSSTNNITNPDDAVWPQEFQNLDWYNRAGKIGKWDAQAWEDPFHPDVEFRRGDFFDLKDLNLSRNDTLAAVIKVYQYWIALSDCDGFRIDTVKHLPWEISRNFCGAIHEYAESIGKENFLLLGEVTGGAGMAHKYIEIFGRNIDAVLDIGEPTNKLAGMVKGFTPPNQFFRQFGGHDQLGSHRETGRYHVSILDDHDMVGRSGKHRFAAGNNDFPHRYAQVAHAVGAQLTTLGIPCLYYGTEQAFDGTQSHHDYSIEPDLTFEDRYIRESMFGGTFGAFETAGCHFFNPNHPSYLRIAAIARIRNAEDAVGRALRGGRQYLREISVDGSSFDIPNEGKIISWSRILFNQEVLVVLNSNGGASHEAEITLDGALHPVGSQMKVLYRGDWSDTQLKNPPSNQTVEVKANGGRAIVQIQLPPAGMVILA